MKGYMGACEEKNIKVCELEGQKSEATKAGALGLNPLPDPCN